MFSIEIFDLFYYYNHLIYHLFGIVAVNMKNTEKFLSAKKSQFAIIIFDIQETIELISQPP
jgi:hypothetical protein